MSKELTDKGLEQRVRELEQAELERNERDFGLEKTRKELEVIKKSADAAHEFANSVINTVRELLENILPQNTVFDDYEVEHDFATIGKRVMLLNALQIEQGMGKERIILLAIMR